MMWLITAALLLVPLVDSQNNESVPSFSTGTAVTVVASSSTIMAATSTGCPTPSTSSTTSPTIALAPIVSGVAIGAFLMGLIIGALGVFLGLLAIKRPCSVDSRMSSSEKTQRFTRSETLSKKQSFNAVSDAPPPSSPLYHTKQEKEATDDEDESRDELDETVQSKGPLPPVPAPHAPPPLPPPATPAIPTGRTTAAKPASFTEEYDIPYVRSATKPSETPLEEYDIPDISTPLGLTVKPLSKSQTNITKEPSTPLSKSQTNIAKEPITPPFKIDRAKMMRKPLVPSKSLGNIAHSNNEELPSEHYYVMDMNADAAVACTMPRVNVPAHPHVKPTPPRTRKPTNRHDQQHGSVPMEDPFSPPHVLPQTKKPALRPPIPSPSSNKATVTKAYSSKPIQQKPPLAQQVRSHSQSVLTNEPHQYKNIEGRNADLTKQLKNRHGQVKASLSTDPYSSGPAQYMNIGHRQVASKKS